MSATGSSSEFEFIRSIQSLCGTSPDVIQGIGDDCAVVRVGDRIQVISCDAFVENIHFRRDWASPQEIGWKATASALSDIAAMGARPLFILTALAAPKEWSSDSLIQVYEGIRDAATACGAVVIGGDTTRSPSGLMLDVTVIGEAVDGHYVLRKGAESGDVLLVTGTPGRSRAGLLALQNGIDAPDAIHAHHHPIPRVEAGQWLAQSQYVHAMMDVSDGLAQDAGHIAQASDIGVELISAQVEDDAVLHPMCDAQGITQSELVFTGGEDYELAVAVDPEHVAIIIQTLKDEFGLAVHALGNFSDSFSGVRIDGVAVESQGYDHFRDDV